MNDRDRIMGAAGQNGWRPSGLQSAMKFSKGGRDDITVRFDSQGKAVEARVRGRSATRSVAAMVIQEMRQG